VNKPLSVIAVLVGFYRLSKSPTHSHSSFILCGVIIIIIIELEITNRVLLSEFLVDLYREYRL